jgi:multiple sugar transport system substrate-binding protein
MPTPAYPEPDPAAGNGAAGFTGGRGAMAPHGRWRVSEIRRLATFPWDVAPMPKGKAGRVGYGWFSGMSLVRGTKIAGEAWEFAKFWGTEAGQRRLTEGGQNVPPLPRMANSPTFLRSTPPENNKAYLDAIANSRLHISGYIVETGKYNEIINPALDAVWKGEKTAKTALPPLIPQLNDVLALS